MFSARKSILTVSFLLASALCGLPAFSQSTQFLRVEARSLRVPGISLPAKGCSSNSDRSLAALYGDTYTAEDSPLPCDQAMPILPSATPVSPCVLNPAAAGCAAPRDMVRDDLNAMGKQGQSILRARDKVLEILQAANTCTEWFQTKESNPAAVFRTLTFSLDRNGEIYVRRIPEPDGMELMRSPYVARVLQGQGANTAVTINANGAFFVPMANVIDSRAEGGPFTLRGVRPVQVGPYPGGTFRAQVLALLHELGHVINLLPPDYDDSEGKSRQNTANVLQACRAQVESK